MITYNDFKHTKIKKGNFLIYNGQNYVEAMLVCDVEHDVLNKKINVIGLCVSLETRQNKMRLCYSSWSWSVYNFLTDWFDRTIVI